MAEDAGRVSWVQDRIVFDRRNKDDYFDIWTMKADGTDQKCLTCYMCPLPEHGHKANPDWDPTGQYIVFQAENSYQGGGKAAKFFAGPGSGLNNDLWVMDAEGKRFKQLSRVPERTGGTLHPHFSPDGKNLLWTERFSPEGGASGQWSMKLATFSLDPKAGPQINDIQSLRPGTQKQFYETQGFSSDGGKIVFSGNLSLGQDAKGNDIYTLDLKSGALKNLTNTPDEWDEYAHYAPSGKHIVWMSNRGLPKPATAADVRSDYWIMDSDGANQRRLTFFNDRDSRDYVAGGAVADDFSWNSDGTALAAVLIEDVVKGASKIVEIDFKEAQ